MPYPHGGWFDLGNAFTGGDLSPDNLPMLLAIYQDLGVDAMNVATGDFRYGFDFLQRLLADSGLPVISANLVWADSRELLFPPRVTMADTLGGLTLIGLTEAPAGRNLLPHVRKQFEGVDFIPLSQALKTQLDQLSGDAGVGILYDGSARGLREILRGVASRTGGNIWIAAPSEAVQAVGKAPPGIRLIPVAGDGASLTRFQPGEIPEIRVMPLTAQTEPDAQILGLLNENGIPFPLSSNAPPEVPTDISSPPLSDMPIQDLGLGDEVSLQRSVANRGLRLAVHGLSLLESFGDVQASPGRRFARVEVSFENRQAIDLLLEKDYPEPLLVGELPNQLFLIVNHRVVASIADPSLNLPLSLPQKFTLKQVGAQARGQVVFDVPDSDIFALSLIYVSEKFPALVLQLIRDDPLPEGDVVAADTSNGFLTLKVVGFKRVEQFRGVPAPAGMRWAVVDLLGTSQRTRKLDARAVDADADPDATVDVPRPVIYLKARDLLQLVVDGADAYVRDPRLSTLAPEPAFPTGDALGGTAVFPVPADARSFELAVDFPEFQGSVDAAKPDPLRLMLTEKVEIPQEPEGVAVIEDDPLPLSVLGVQVDEASRQLIVEVSISNTSGEGGMFKAGGRGRLRLVNGEFAELRGVELRGGIPLPEAIWIPANDQPRRFRYRFQLPPDTEDAVFIYSGVSKAGQVPLSFSGETLKTGPVADAALETKAGDQAFGNIELPLFPLKEERVASPEAHFTGRNHMVELDVTGLELRENYGDQTFENGRWLVMDLRGRSLRQTPETEPELGGVGTQLSWRDWMLRTQLIVNGDRVFVPNRHQTNIEEPFLMLPDSSTGGEIAFGISDEVLASAESIAFVAGFGAYTNPGERVSTPKPIRIQLMGEPATMALPEDPQAVVEDVDLDLFLVRTERVKEFMGSTTRAGEWVVAELFVRAKAEQGVYLTPNDLVQLLNGKNESVSLRAIGWGGNPTPSSSNSGQWIAPGDVRRVLMAWAPSQPRELHRIRYAGMRHYQHFPLEDPGDQKGDQEVDPSRDPAKNLFISERGRQVLYPDREAKGIAGVDLEPEQVNAAIDRGQAYLWKEIQEVIASRARISRMNYIYPMLYALVNTDLQIKNAEFDEVLRNFLNEVRPDQQTIYENSLLAMILRAYGDPDYTDLLQQAVHYFVEAQGENGTWSYRAKTPAHFFGREDPVLSADGLLISGGENPEIAAERLKEPVYRTQSFTLGSEGDNSCTQFAVLGLWSAQRAGLKVDPDVWKRVLRSATSFQNLRNNESFGGYSYSSSGASYGSMSSAVLCSTAIALRQLDPDLKIKEHLRIRNALGWLAENFSVDLNPNRKEYNYYYLYSLERVGQILGTEFIGDHEWYPLGARYLVDTQTRAGSWPTGPGETDPQLTTSYALLFLLRATPKMAEDLSPDPDAPGILLTRLNRPEVRNRVYVILDASGSMRDQVNGREKFEAARQALGEMLKVLPAGTEVALRVYGHRLLAIEKGAEEDTELVIRWGELNLPEFQKSLQSLTPKGKTPLTFSLKQAVGEVDGRKTEEQTLVVLLTDGGESTRGADPVEAARAFADKEGVQFFVLGFDINREDWTRQLQDMARAAKGVYRPVEDANLLARELVSVIHPPAPAFTLTGDEGGILESGTFEDGEYRLKPGKYIFTLHPGREENTQTFWIRPGGTTRMQVTLDPTRRAPPDEISTATDKTSKGGTTHAAFCTQCGNKLTPGAKFCTVCGKKTAP